MRLVENVFQHALVSMRQCTTIPAPNTSASMPQSAQIIINVVKHAVRHRIAPSTLSATSTVKVRTLNIVYAFDMECNNSSSSKRLIDPIQFDPKALFVVVSFGRSDSAGTKYISLTVFRCSFHFIFSGVSFGCCCVACCSINLSLLLFQLLLFRVSRARVLSLFDASLFRFDADAACWLALCVHTATIAIVVIRSRSLSRSLATMPLLVVVMVVCGGGLQVIHQPTLAVCPYPLPNAMPLYALRCIL